MRSILATLALGLSATAAPITVLMTAGQLLMPQSAYAQAGPPELFEHGPATAADRGKQRPGTVIGTVKLKSDLRKTKRFTLNIPNVPSGQLQVEALSERGAGDFSVDAKGPDSDAQLVVTDDGAATGTVRVGAASYGLQPSGDGTSVLFRLDKEPAHYPNKPVAPREPEKARAESAAADTGARVDVMVVYTARAAASAGDIAALIQLAEDQANAGLAASQVPSRIEIVHTAQVSYTDSGDMGLDLDRVTRTNDGFMDEVHGWRDTYKADLVVLLTAPGNYGGVAWVNSSQAYGFSVTATDAVYYNTFHHEIGHNWWMRHNPEEDGSTSPLAYAHGYCDRTGNFRTVMSYNMGCSARINQYSTPSLTHNGRPTGTASTSDNARVAREKAATIANFRLGGDDPPTPTATWHDWASAGGNLGSYPECEPTGSGAGIACWARGGSGSLIWNRSADGKAWDGWVDLGGTPSDAPECLVRGRRIDCFVTTTANKLAQKIFNGSAWSSWADRAGIVTRQPSCLPAASGTGLDCFTAATDGSLRRRQFDGTTWLAWQNVVGKTTLRPECARIGAAIQCLIVDAGGNLKGRRLSGTTWSAWTQVGTGFAAAPQCLVSGSALECFAQSANKQLLNGRHNGTSWSTWANLGGDVASPPSCSRVSTGYDCYWTTSAFKLVRRQRSGATWQAQVDLGGTVQQKPACLVRNDGARVDCLARGTDNTLQQRSYY